MEIEKGLLSLLTPCYNGEKHIYRLLDSVLKQDYPSIEHFVIDDGSTDDTKSIIEKYIPLYEKKGYKLTYIYQENSGQSVAINRGLKLIKGEFFAWPDADDFYAVSFALSELVNSLKVQDKTFSMVRSLLRYLDEDNLTEISKTVNLFKNKTDLFEDCLFQTNKFWYVPGTYLCRTETLFKVVKDKEIYTDKNAGQNWQLMLPLLFNYKCYTVDKYLYNVLVRRNSHSRESSFERNKLKLNSYENTIVSTLDRMIIPKEQLQYYMRKIIDNYVVMNINLYFDFADNTNGREQYRLKKPKELKLKVRYYLSFFPLGNLLFRILVKLRVI